jgi:16S rRNA (guanine(966)-N(2))-methyltransferase RsmD
MRIVAGSAKGTRLAPVPSGTRPMLDRAREGLFSSLGPSVEGARVLDLFAGTGGIGIEALSRGASEALFVDSAPQAVKTITENLRRTKLSKLGRVRRLDARRAVRERPGPFDLVILDPPHRLEQPGLEALLNEIAGQGIAAPGGRVILSRSTRTYMPVIPVNWLLERRLSYGDTLVFIYRIP